MSKRAETALDILKDRTKERVKAIREFQDAYSQFRGVVRGGATNIAEVEQALRVCADALNEVHGGLVAGLGHMQEADVDNVINSYMHDANMVYNLVEAYARYDPDILAQVVQTAEPETRRDAWQQVDPALRAAILAELKQMERGE